MGDRPLIANVEFQQVRYGRSTFNCERKIRASKTWAIGHLIVIFNRTSQNGRSAITCDVNRASVVAVDRSANTCDVNQASLVGGRPGLAMFNRTSGHSANTCDVNRVGLVGGRLALAMLIEQVLWRLTGRPVLVMSIKQVWWVVGRHLRCLIEQAGSRSAGKCTGCIVASSPSLGRPYMCRPLGIG